MVSFYSGVETNLVKYTFMYIIDVENSLASLCVYLFLNPVKIVIASNMT